MTNFGSNSDIISAYDDVLHENSGSKDFYVTQNFIDAITENGLTLQRSKTEYGSFKYLKITITRPATIVPGYELLYNGEPHPIAWGKDTYAVPKRKLLNLTNGDIIHASWDINETWEAKSWAPTCMRLVSQYNNSNTIGTNNTSINSNDDPKEKAFTLTTTDISTIKSTELVVSGYYFNLTKAVLEHPSRFTSVTMNSDGLSTFGHTTEAIDCSWFESLGLKAYTATISGDRIVTTKVTEAVPAGTGLILQGEPNATYKLPFASGADAVVGNVLQPTTGENVSGYVLAKHNTLGIGFYQVTNKAVDAGKAYIPNISSAARYFTIDFLDDEPTSIQNAPITKHTAAQEAYNFMGQRVAANSKGLVIINGKKVFNK